MFKYLTIFHILFLSIFFSSCKSVENDDPDAANWDMSVLDAAKKVDYLSRGEKDVILEMNKVRTDPQKYARLYLQPELQYYNGKMYQKPGQMTMMTNEGKEAVEECIAALSKMAKGSVLIPELGLSRAAKDHAADQGKTGQIGHTGSDGSSLTDRIKKYGSGFSSVGENIAYGDKVARNIVIRLLIDDGLPSRGHRTNIMNPVYTKTGVATGSHPRYGSMCVIDLANSYISK
jgi:uncharacterized protein YkwD